MYACLFIVFGKTSLTAASVLNIMHYSRRYGALEKKNWSFKCNIYVDYISVSRTNQQVQYFNYRHIKFYKVNIFLKDLIVIEKW